MQFSTIILKRYYFSFFLQERFFNRSYIVSKILFWEIRLQYFYLSPCNLTVFIPTYSVDLITQWVFRKHAWISQRVFLKSIFEFSNVFVLWKFNIDTSWIPCLSETLFIWNADRFLRKIYKEKIVLVVKS